MNLHGDDSVFVKGEPKDETKSTGQTSSSSGANPDSSTAGGEASTSVKKELDGTDLIGTSAVPNNAMGIQIKNEPIDEITTSNVNEHSLHVRQQIVPVIKTEIGNSVPIVSNASIQRPITIQQAAHLQHHQPHQQTFATNDQTLILSSRPIRRLTTTNGPADGKAGKLSLLFSILPPFPFHFPGLEFYDIPPKMVGIIFFVHKATLE